jgi:serine/threonine-protein kinase
MVEGMTPQATPSPSPPVHGGRRPAPKQEAPAPVAAVSSKASVSLNSVPASNVILNGRPLGQTPKMSVSTDPGPQTVVFVHPEHGRKVMSGTVGPGENKTFIAKFP